MEKSGCLGTVEHQRPDDLPCEHELHHKGGRLHELKLDSHGKKELVPCDDPFIRFRDDRASHRVYLEWNLRCSGGLSLGSKPVPFRTVRWTVTEDNAAFNVAENLRALAPGTERYAQAHGWRQNVENDNHQSDAAKVQRRDRSSRPGWNHINELGWALVQNGIALQRHRQRGVTRETGDTPVLAPTAA